jgi:hypothetical protein
MTSHGPKQGSGKSTQHPYRCNAIRLRSSLSASIHPDRRSAVPKESNLRIAPALVVPAAQCCQQACPRCCMAVSPESCSRRPSIPPCSNTSQGRGGSSQRHCILLDIACLAAPAVYAGPKPEQYTSGIDREAYMNIDGSTEIKPQGQDLRFTKPYTAPIRERFFTHRTWFVLNSKGSST